MRLFIREIPTHEMLYNELEWEIMKLMARAQVDPLSYDIMYAYTSVYLLMCVYVYTELTIEVCVQIYYCLIENRWRIVFY